MRYLIYDKDQIMEAMIYCNNEGDETPKDIAKAIVTEFYVGEFVAEKHLSITSPIKNDDNMYILVDSNGHNNIWQICGRVYDYTSSVIPHLYKVRKIGIMFK